MWIESLLSLVIVYFLGTFVSEAIKTYYWKKRNQGQQTEEELPETLKQKIIDKIQLLKKIFTQWLSKLRGS